MVKLVPATLRILELLCTRKDLHVIKANRKYGMELLHNIKQGYRMKIMEEKSPDYHHNKSHHFVPFPQKHCLHPLTYMYY